MIRMYKDLAQLSIIIFKIITTMSTIFGMKYQTKGLCLCMTLAVGGMFNVLYNILILRARAQLFNINDIVS